MAADLLPCPFCGGEAIAIQGFTDTVHVGCQTDGCLGSCGTGNRRLLFTRERWNKRAPSAPAPAAPALCFPLAPPGDPAYVAAPVKVTGVTEAQMNHEAASIAALDVLQAHGVTNINQTVLVPALREAWRAAIAAALKAAGRAT